MRLELAARLGVLTSRVLIGTCCLLVVHWRCRSRLLREELLFDCGRVAAVCLARGWQDSVELVAHWLTVSLEDGDRGDDHDVDKQTDQRHGHDQDGDQVVVVGQHCGASGLCEWGE